MFFKGIEVNQEMKVYKGLLSMSNRVRNLTSQDNQYKDMERVISQASTDLLEEKDQLMLFYAIKRLYNFALRNRTNSLRDLYMKRRRTKNLSCASTFGQNKFNPETSPLDSDLISEDPYSEVNLTDPLYIYDDDMEIDIIDGNLFDQLDELLNVFFMIESASMTIPDIFLIKNESKEFISFQVRSVLTASCCS